MIFLLFTVQLLFGLYARTTITAIGADIASEAAVGIPRGAEAGAFEAEAISRLGRYGDHAAVAVALTDADGDGTADTVAVTIEADLPNLLPDRWVPGDGDTVSRTMRARLEQFDDAGQGDG